MELSLADEEGGGKCGCLWGWDKFVRGSGTEIKVVSVAFYMLYQIGCLVLHARNIRCGRSNVYNMRQRSRLLARGKKFARCKTL